MLGLRNLMGLMAGALIAVCAMAAPPTGIEPVISKLKKDRVSLAQFMYLGKIHCLDQYLTQEPSGLTLAYGSAFNQLYPLPRLIKESALKAKYQQIELARGRSTSWRSKSSRAFIDPVSECQRVYSASNVSTAAYQALVADLAAYHSAEDVDIEAHVRDYLEHFFIQLR